MMNNGIKKIFKTKLEEIDDNIWSVRIERPGLYGRMETICEFVMDWKLRVRILDEQIEFLIKECEKYSRDNSVDSIVTRLQLQKRLKSLRLEKELLLEHHLPKK